MTKKDVIVLLIERKYSLEEIQKLTGYSMPTIYYSNKSYKKACAEIDRLKDERAKIGTKITTEIIPNPKE